MKILLGACNAKYIHSNLAIYNLRAYAGKYKNQIVLKEYTINQSKDLILKDIYKTRPEIICMSCYIWNISFIREILREVSKILPETIIWTGGPEVSYNGEAFLRENPHIKGVMTGEGEASFLELVSFYHKKKEEQTDTELGKIAGIVYRKGEEIISTGPRGILDLSTVPFAYEDLAEFENRIIYYESSRGCPFSCSYCLSSIDKKLRFRSLDLVKKELQFFLDHKVAQVKFVDRTFNCKKSHAMEIWQYITEHDNHVTNFHFEIAADLLDEEQIQLMSRMRPGLIQLEIGVQSTNPDTIREIRRKMDFSQVCEIVKKIQELKKVHQHLDLIAGLPFEDLESFRNSFNEVYALRPQQLQLGFLKVLKGSYMYQKAADYGCVSQSKEPYEVLYTNWLSYEEVLKLKNVESMVEIYYNSGQFVHTLLYIEEFFSHPFELYEKLGEFYENRGYDAVSHSRMRRYEILLEFLEEYPGISQETVKEKMIYDLYLRENLKSRPSWAGDQREYEKMIWEYRRRKKILKTAHIEALDEHNALLFEYEHRDPLTYNASVQKIDLDITT